MNYSVTEIDFCLQLGFKEKENQKCRVQNYVIAASRDPRPIVQSKIMYGSMNCKQIMLSASKVRKLPRKCY